MAIPNGDDLIFFLFLDFILVQILFLQVKRLYLQVKGTRCDIMRAFVFTSLGTLPFSRRFYIQDNFVQGMQCLFSSQLSQSPQAVVISNQL